MDQSRVERRIQEFKARVVKAAAELFATQGIEATTLDDICEAADVAKRTLCNHFSTKAEIVDAVASGAVSQTVALVDAARRNGSSTRERLSLFFDSLLAARRSQPPGEEEGQGVHPDFVVGLFVPSREGSAQREIRLSDSIRELLAEGGSDELPPGCTVEALADVVLGSTYSITLESAFRSDYDAAHHLRMVRDFLVGLLPQPRQRRGRARSA